MDHPPLWPLALVTLVGCGSLELYGDPASLDALGDTAALPLGDTDDEGASPGPGLTSGGEDCTDGIDNDGDQQPDCDDSDCDAICDGDGDGAIAESLGGDDCDDSNPAVHPMALEICNDGLDNDCANGDCTDFQDDFDSGGIAPAWTFSGAEPWTLAPGYGYNGSTGSRSGSIGHNESSRMEVLLDFPVDGTLEFRHMGSSELNYDHLRFFVDGELRGEWSGSWAWTLETYPVPAGQHVFSWRYVKDGTLSSGQDSAIVDDVIAYGGVP